MLTSSTIFFSYTRVSLKSSNILIRYIVEIMSLCQTNLQVVISINCTLKAQFFHGCIMSRTNILIWQLFLFSNKAGETKNFTHFCKASHANISSESSSMILGQCSENLKKRFFTQNNVSILQLCFLKLALLQK